MTKKTQNRINPHDRYMRSVLGNIPVAREFFEKHLPSHVQSLVDLSTLEPPRESFIDEKLSLQIADVLYSVRVQDKVGYFYILLEHASKADKWLPFRMLKYMVGIMDFHLNKKGHGELPIIYPMILYTGARPFRHSLDLFDLFGPHKELADEILYKPVHLIDLQKMPDAQIKRDYFYFSAAAFIAKHIHDDNVLRMLRQALEILRALEENGVVNDTMVTLQYIVEAASVADNEAFAEVVTTTMSGIDKEQFMRTMAERWKKEAYVEGIEAGLLQGIEKGVEQGIEKVALNLLEQNMPLGGIVSVTGLSVERIKNLRVSH